MRSLSIIILLDFVAQAHAEERATSYVADTQGSANNVADDLVDSFFNRALKVSPLHRADLDDTTFGKAAPGIRNVNPLSTASRASGLSTSYSASLMAHHSPGRLASWTPGTSISRSPGLKTSWPAGIPASRYAAKSTQVRNPVVTRAADTEIMEDSPFDASKISFGSFLLPSGALLLGVGFGGYFGLIPDFGSISGVLLIYGFPATVLGAALKYGELKPVECKTTKGAFALRDSQMTDIQKQVREDVTRFRYGDEEHLDLALEKIFRIGAGKTDNIPRSLCPKLRGVREETTDGMYTLVLEFEDPSEQTKKAWEGKREKFETFFGPGIKATTTETKRGMDVALISDGSGAGMGGEEKEVLPPLMPGMAPRTREKETEEKANTPAPSRAVVPDLTDSSAPKRQVTGNDAFARAMRKKQEQEQASQGKA